MASFTYDAINAQGLLLSGEIHAADLIAAREQLRARGLLRAGAEGAPGQQRRRRMTLQEGQAEVAPDLLAPARDDDRGRASTSSQAFVDARAADRRQVPAPGHRRDPLRRRGGHDPLAGVRAAPEGLQPALRGDDRSRRVVGHARQRARPPRDPDREGDAAQAPREVARWSTRSSSSPSRRSCSSSCSCSSSRSSRRCSTSWAATCRRRRRSDRHMSNVAARASGADLPAHRPLVIYGSSAGSGRARPPQVGPASSSGSR